MLQQLAVRHFRGFDKRDQRYAAESGIRHAAVQELNKRLGADWEARACFQNLDIDVPTTGSYERRGRLVAEHIEKCLAGDEATQRVAMANELKRQRNLVEQVRDLLAPGYLERARLEGLLEAETFPSVLSDLLGQIQAERKAQDDRLAALGAQLDAEIAAA